MNTIAYIRVSTDKQTVENQRDEINRYAVKNKMIVDDWFSFEISSRKSDEQRGITKLFDVLNDGDTLIVSELSRLGRSTSSVLDFINKLIDKGVRCIFIKQGLDVDKNSKNATTKVMLTLFSLFAELERDFISQRTKEALSSRKGKGILGHKTGTILPSKYDKKIGHILELKELGLSNAKIINHIGFGTIGTLDAYLKKRFEVNMFGGLSLKLSLKKYYVIIDGQFKKVTDAK
jgi:DNA invertase Pin-like site-specific DNA recombinase